ncbi:hypothetical protein COX24_01910 [bacterium (Candidatus Gribaldobacteria) CG23_combo_of_CG06-09_8_20_14_all_37_87_8]|uniref:Uncharacterized protein n=2 Tax=Candidatus Gribaldobacteria TaxID=2798536 RepID=A0A2G9ZF06_9BACT|nr:MAG: hypothetical protein AUJ25_00145 [Parcubacteria group bacterium CG1_02_37_13]PIP31752.1 MAG: hypothetical protein COX24_01910 [bacterium (Candidatus Gribaldobacteria) CG23_combo_of_CG06-09_8_20_14_all_37_87_8]PIR90521.1 MAG: hypothetical protein COU05_01570 [bacterium (Candidatus Gribaldobacteria) CG10_big_fil_rev_8_21_14_0_10_37_21]
MYDFRLKEQIDKIPAPLFKINLLKELRVQEDLPNNGAWNLCFTRAIKGALNVSNGEDPFSLLKTEDPDNLKKLIFEELDYQKYLMEEEKGKRTNEFRPFCSLIWAVLERAQDGN